MEKIYISLIITFASLFSFAQEESENCLPPSKKVVKLIKAALEAKDVRTTIENFNAAIKLDDENATVYYEYGMYAYNEGLKNYETYPNPARGDRSFIKAEEMFRITLDNCSDYHANCSYYLGVINYTQQDMPEAIKWFKAFKKYQHSDTDRYPDDFTKKLADVTEVLADLERDRKVKEKVVPFKPKLVRNVSTANNEYFPMLSPDNELIFYTRKLDRKGMGDMMSNVVEEITFSKRSSVLINFDSGEPLKAPFNDGTFQSYGAATLSVDNKEMIVCACKKEKIYEQPYMNCDLYITTYERSGAGGNDFSWTPLENMGDKINTPDGWEAQPSLSADGKTLYYTVNRPSSQNNDIYVAERQEDGSWISRPFDEINTAGKDKSPFLHQDSETLYFVSESTKDRPGVGGLDIFYIRKENGKWTKPKNIGYPINSPEDELGLYVSIDGEVAYFSSRVGGKWNIYSFELYEEARPQSVAILKGELKDENGEAVQDATIEITYEGSDEVTEVKVNGDDGKYAAIIKTKVKQDVMVTVKKEGHAFDSKLITKEEIAKVIEKKPVEEHKQKSVEITGRDLAVKKLKMGEAYTINDILFATNSYELNKNSKFILRGFARFLLENETITVAIQGHTDDVGDDTRNMELSEQRAQEVKKYLATQKIDAKRLSAKGYGETQPKLPNSSSINRAKNRRTDFVIEGM
ncbi:MAG: OmpA family protein [Fluviicola sp.]|nr:OmpA family protein [Fluviicola sp.]